MVEEKVEKPEPFEAKVETVCREQGGNGFIRLLSEKSNVPIVLTFSGSPAPITLLKGYLLWGGEEYVMFEDLRIADRIGGTEVKFDGRRLETALRRFARKP